MKEREEALMRILVGIIGGIILYFWTWIVGILAIVNIIVTLVQGKRLREFFEFNELFVIQIHAFWNYITGNSDVRPFPFNNLEELKELEEKVKKNKKGKRK